MAVAGRGDYGFVGCRRCGCFASCFRRPDGSGAGRGGLQPGRLRRAGAPFRSGGGGGFCARQGCASPAGRSLALQLASGAPQEFERSRPTPRWFIRGGRRSQHLDSSRPARLPLRSVPSRWRARWLAGSPGRPLSAPARPSSPAGDGCGCGCGLAGLGVLCRSAPPTPSVLSSSAAAAARVGNARASEPVCALRLARSFRFGAAAAAGAGGGGGAVIAGWLGVPHSALDSSQPSLPQPPLCRRLDF